VDDSQAILAFEEAVLGGHYTLAKATGGREGLRLARALSPAAILLDLSMPEMDGEQVLRALKADDATRSIPVIIVSNEHARAQACLKDGASDFVPKPIRRDALLSAVERVLSRSRATAEAEQLGVLVVEAAGVLVGIKLDAVRAVALQPETRPIDAGCPFLCEMVDFRGVSVGVLDLAAWLGKDHDRPAVDRKLVVVRTSPPLALCVDDVREPELVPAMRVARGDSLQRARAPLAEAAVAMVSIAGAAEEVPLVELALLLPPPVRDRLPGVLAACAGRPSAPPSMRPTP
jgi:CheY-like chemotaxis protein